MTPSDMPEVRPSFWQLAPCPKCGQKAWAVPWEPQTACLACGAKRLCVAVYLPTNPGGSTFGKANS